MVLDAALLLQFAPLRMICSPLILVCTDTKERVRRVQARDALSEEDALKAVSKQLPESVQRTYADIILDNNKDLQALQSRVLTVWKEELYGH